jgi:hypothetical protein
MMNSKTEKCKSQYCFISLLLFFVICRLPVILHNQEINPDESQMLTQALTLKFVSPVWGVAVDGTTSGPLNTYFLYFLNLLGLPLDYTTAHLANVILCILSLVFIFKICQKLTSNQSTQLAILIPILFLSLTQHSDLVSYNSEMLSVLLTSICGYLLVLIYQNDTKIGRHIFTLGLVASLVPFAKIQAVFIVLGILILLLILLISNKIHFKYYAVGIFGAMVFPAVFFGILYKNDVLGYFMNHYITGNAAITKFGEIDGRLIMTPVSAIDSLKSLFIGISQSRDLIFLVLNVAAISAWCLVLVNSEKRIVKNEKRESFFILHSSFFILLLFTLYAIAKPGIGRVHYFLFLLLPLTVWVAIWVESAVRSQELGIRKQKLEFSNQKSVISNSFFVFRYTTIHYSLLAILVTTSLLNLTLRFKPDGVLNKYKIQTTIPASNLGLKIAEYTNPNEAVTIWGWACKYHVEIQSPQATRHNHSILETIENYPYRSDYYQEYVAELTQNLPPVIIDAVGAKSSGIKNRPLYNLNQYVELRNLVNNNYFVASKTNDYVVYVRKDRY